MLASLFVKIFLLQVTVVFIIVYILKKILDTRLINTAIDDFLRYQPAQEESSTIKIIVVSHKPLHPKYSLRIKESIRKILGQDVTPSYEVKKGVWGGLIIYRGEHVIDYSLKDRLKQAFP